MRLCLLVTTEATSELLKHELNRTTIYLPKSMGKENVVLILHHRQINAESERNSLNMEEIPIGVQS